MLDKHLIAKTRPVANEKNVVRFNDYRITVLADQLFRVEKDIKGKFCDKATQSVWYRDAKEVDFKVKKFSDKIEITTSKVKLVVNNEYEKSYAVVEGKKKKLSNEGNLLGTFRTLDGCDGDTYVYCEDHVYKPIELCTGVCSTTGVAILEDKHTLILDEDGMLKERPKQEIDEYVFAFGKDYKGAVKALYDITGYIPKIPRFALGNWWSRYHAYSDTEYLNLLDKFEEYDIPLTVAVVDMDWHYSDYVNEELKITETGHRHEKYGCGVENERRLGWTGYSWNKNLFPDYKGFLNKINEKNLKITLNLHPKDGVRYYEDMYKEMCEAMGQDASEELPVEFNLTDHKFINNYFKILHKPYEHDGVAFWWIDWQQGTKSQMAGLDPLWALNHYHFLDNGLESADPLILSRFCEAGSHRYPLGFSADTTLSFKTLGYLPYFTATASNIGYTWWSHDIGGHHQGYTDNELFVRSVQYGIFSPIMRLHSTAYEAVTKEPWAYMGGAQGLIADALRYRHSLIPFIYSEGCKTNKFGKAIIEPVYYYYPDSKCAYKYKNEYFFGDLLVNPITTRTQSYGISTVKGWIPEGRWTDIFTGEEYLIGEGGKEVTFYRWLDSIPVLAKAGSTLVRSGVKHSNDYSNPVKLILEVYSGNGSYDLYEDDGKNEAITRIVNASDGKTLTTTISFEGETFVMPQGRELKIQLKNVFGGKPTVTADGEPVDVTYKCDEFVELVIKNVDYSKTYVVTIDETPLTDLEYAVKRAVINLQRFEIMNVDKEDFLNLCNNRKWVPQKGCHVYFDEPVFDGKANTMTKLASEYLCDVEFRRGRTILGDPFGKEKIPAIYVKKLAESLRD